MSARILACLAIAAGAAFAACTAGSSPTDATSVTGAGGDTGGPGGTTSTSAGEGGTQFATGTTGAGGEGVGGGCAAVSQTATNQVKPVDIIWAIDTSDSMVAELQAVQDNMNTFASTILNQGIDVHVVLIAKPGKPDGGNIFNPDPGLCISPPLATGTCPGGSKPPNYQHVESGVGSNNALNKFIEQYPAYKGTLRKNAVKYFAVVSDDEASDGPYDSASKFIAGVDALDPGMFDVWKFFGVFCTGNCNVFLACAATGNVYLDLVAQKGGISGDLCGGNSAGFAPVFTALAQTVVSGKELDCQWPIPPAPAGQTFEKDKVNVKYTPSMGPSSNILHVATAADCGPQGGWYYDDDANPKNVLVCPATCTGIKADAGGKVDILFGCFTVDVPK